MRVLRTVLVPLALCLPMLAGPVFYQYNLAAAGVANADSDIDQTSPAWTGIWGGQAFTKGAINVNIASQVQNSPILQNDTRLAAVPFSIATGQGAESWSGQVAWQNSGSPDPAAETGVTIAANGENAEMVFLMINTFWGTTGPAAVEVTLAFQSGASLTYSLIGNTDIRDHHDSQLVLGRELWTNRIGYTERPSGNGGSQVTVNETTREFQYDSKDHRVYRDVVTLILPSNYWNEILSSIYIRDKGLSDVGALGNPNASRVWLWSATTLGADISQIPEPATSLLVGAGLGLAALFVRRRRSA